MGTNLIAENNLKILVHTCELGRIIYINRQMPRQIRIIPNR